MEPRRVLHDDGLQRRLEEVGYVVVPLLDEEQTAHLYQWYEARAGSTGPNPPGAYNDTYAEFSVIHSYPEFRRDAFHEITSIAVPQAERYLLDYEPLVANFVNKPPGTGIVPAHQNFAVVDESRFRSVSVWIALVDCIVENGAMQMLDGSHDCFRGRRGLWSYHSFAAVEDLLVADYLTPVVVPAGSAIVLDDAVVHYSPPNTSASRRLAIQLVMIPAEADALFFEETGQHDGSLEVDVWRVTPPFFWNFWHGHGDAEHGEVVDRVTVPLPNYDRSTLERLVLPGGGPTQR